MPGVQKGKSSLLAKHAGKLNSAIAKHASEPVKYGAGRLPPGIKNGVAQLVEIVFGEVEQGKQNAGQLYFRAAGVVISPDTVNVDGIDWPVRGERTSIFEMLCDTKTAAGKVTSCEEHVANVLNELKKLGAEFGDDASAADLEQAAADLVEAGPYFKFRTSAGKATEQYPEPKTFENWDGIKGLEDFVPPDAEAIEDETGEADTETETENESSEEPPQDDVETAAGDGDADGALADLAARATAEGGEGGPACDELTALAVAKGMSEDDVANSASWDDVAAFVAGGEGEQTEEAASEEEPEPEPPPAKPVTKPTAKPTAVAPKKSAMVKYQRVDKAGKPLLDKNKKKTRPVDCQVTAVYPKNKTADLLNFDDRKTTYKGVAWSALIAG